MKINRDKKQAADYRHDEKTYDPKTGKEKSVCRLPFKVLVSDDK